MKAMENKLLLPTPEEQLESMIAKAGASDIRNRALEQSSEVESGMEVDQVAKALAQQQDIESLPNVQPKVKKDDATYLKDERQSEAREGAPPESQWQDLHRPVQGQGMTGKDHE